MDKVLPLYHQSLQLGAARRVDMPRASGGESCAHGPVTSSKYSVRRRFIRAKHCGVHSGKEQPGKPSGMMQSSASSRMYWLR